MEYRKIFGKKHYIFDSLSEMAEHFGSEMPEVIDNWREAKKFDWVKSDDGRYLQILGYGTLKHPGDTKNYKLHNSWCRTIVGTFFQDTKIKMDTDFEKHPSRYRFGNAANTSNAYRAKHRKTLTKAERIFALTLAQGHTLQTAFERAYGPSSHWKVKAEAMIRRKIIMDEVNKNILELADDIGLNQKYYLLKLKSILESADNEHVLLAALKELGEVLGTKERTRQVTQGNLKLFQPVSVDEVMEIEAEKIEAVEIEN